MAFPRLNLLALLLSTVQAASLQQLNVTLANNPTNVGFYIYVPDEVSPSPPILVNPHWCHGDAPAAYAGSTFANLASEYGFIVIYPDSPNLVDKCWDVSSPQTLTHDGGGDSTGIVSMVNWTLQRFDADPERVFVTGVSSGAMMTNVLVGAVRIHSLGIRPWGAIRKLASEAHLISDCLPVPRYVRWRLRLRGRSPRVFWSRHTRRHQHRRLLELQVRRRPRAQHTTRVGGHRAGCVSGLQWVAAQDAGVPRDGG